MQHLSQHHLSLLCHEHNEELKFKNSKATKQYRKTKKFQKLLYTLDKNIFETKNKKFTA